MDERLEWLRDYGVDPDKLDEHSAAKTRLVMPAVCPSCQSSETRGRYHRGGWREYTCLDCGSEFKNRDSRIASDDMFDERDLEAIRQIRKDPKDNIELYEGMQPESITDHVMERHDKYQTHPLFDDPDLSDEEMARRHERLGPHEHLGSVVGHETDEPHMHDPFDEGELIGLALHPANEGEAPKEYAQRMRAEHQANHGNWDFDPQCPVCKIMRNDHGNGHPAYFADPAIGNPGDRLKTRDCYWCSKDYQNRRDEAPWYKRPFVSHADSSDKEAHLGDDLGFHDQRDQWEQHLDTERAPDTSKIRDCASCGEPWGFVLSPSLGVYVRRHLDERESDHPLSKGHRPIEEHEIIRGIEAHVSDDKAMHHANPEQLRTDHPYWDKCGTCGGDGIQVGSTDVLTGEQKQSPCKDCGGIGEAYDAEYWDSDDQLHDFSNYPNFHQMKIPDKSLKTHLKDVHQTDKGYDDAYVQHQMTHGINVDPAIAEILMPKAAAKTAEFDRTKYDEVQHVDPRWIVKNVKPVDDPTWKQNFDWNDIEGRHFLDDVKANGVNEPVHTKNQMDGGGLEMANGHHRVWAAIRAGLASVPLIHHDEYVQLEDTEGEGLVGHTECRDYQNSKEASKTAVNRTRSWYLKQRDALVDQVGPDKSDTVHEFGDGWTIKHLNTVGDARYEGTLMKNCIKDIGKHPCEDCNPYGVHDHGTCECLTCEGTGHTYDPPHTYIGDALRDGDSEDAFEMDHRLTDDNHIGRIYSLRDPDNIPQVSFTMHDKEDYDIDEKKGFGIENLNGRTNRAPKPEYAMKVVQFFKDATKDEPGYHTIEDGSIDHAIHVFGQHNSPSATVSERRGCRECIDKHNSEHIPTWNHSEKSRSDDPNCPECREPRLFAGSKTAEFTPGDTTYPFAETQTPDFRPQPRGLDPWKDRGDNGVPLHNDMVFDPKLKKWVNPEMSAMPAEVNYPGNGLMSQSSTENETSWHLTDNPKFALNPDYSPENNTTLGGDYPHKGIFLGEPEHWLNGFDYVRPFVAEISHPPLEELGGYGREKFLLADQFDKATVKRVIPLDEYCHEEFHSPGWIERSHRESPDIPSDYRYTGPDVRDMSKDEVNYHLRRTNEYIKSDRPHLIICKDCPYPKRDHKPGPDGWAWKDYGEHPFKSPGPFYKKVSQTWTQSVDAPPNGGNVKRLPYDPYPEGKGETHTLDVLPAPTGEDVKKWKTVKTFPGDKSFADHPQSQDRIDNMPQVVGATGAPRVTNMDKIKNYLLKIGETDTHDATGGTPSHTCQACGKRHSDVSFDIDPKPNWRVDGMQGTEIDAENKAYWIAKEDKETLRYSPAASLRSHGYSDGPAETIHQKGFDEPATPFHIKVLWNPYIHERDHATMNLLHEAGHYMQAKQDWDTFHNKAQTPGPGIHGETAYERDAFQKGMDVAKAAGVRVTPNMKQQWKWAVGGEHLAHGGDDLGFHDESDSWEDRAQDRGMWGSNPVPAQNNQEEGVCRHCHRRIINDEKDGWVDPEATGDDGIWRDMCDAHDTFEATHEPEGPYYDEDDDPNGMKTAGFEWIKEFKVVGGDWSPEIYCPKCGSDRTEATGDHETIGDDEIPEIVREERECHDCGRYFQWNMEGHHEGKPYLKGPGGTRIEGKTALLDYDPVRDVQPSSNSAPAPDATKPVGDPWPNQVHDGVNPDRPGYIFDKKLKKFIRDEQLTYPDVGPTFPGVTDINKVGQAHPQPVGMHEGDNGIDDPMKRGDPSQVKKIIPGTQRTVPETNVWNVSIDNLNKTGASNWPGLDKLKRPWAEDRGYEAYDPWLMGGGCAHLALAMKAAWPEGKIAAAWYDDHGRRALSHAAFYDPKSGHAWDGTGAHKSADIAVSTHPGSDIEMDADPHKVAEHMGIDFSDEAPFADDGIADAWNTVDEHFMPASARTCRECGELGVHDTERGLCKDCAKTKEAATSNAARTKTDWVAADVPGPEEYPKCQLCGTNDPEQHSEDNEGAHVQDPGWQGGDRPFYTYRCYEGEDSADAPLWHRSNQHVTVTHRVPNDEVDDLANGGPMYHIKFDDGHEGNAWTDELLLPRLSVNKTGSDDPLNLGGWKPPKPKGEFVSVVKKPGGGAATIHVVGCPALKDKVERGGFRDVTEEDIHWAIEYREKWNDGDTVHSCVKKRLKLGQAQQAADVDGEREPEEPKLTDRQLHVVKNHPMMAEEIASIEELTAFADPELQQLHLQDHALNQHDHNPEVLRVAKRSS